MKPRLSLIVAHTVPGRVIGHEGGMPWHLPADLAHFKSITWGHPILMGRRTQQSIGRALPGRQNLVISRQTDFRAPGCMLYRDLNEVWAQWSLGPELFVIGGATLYETLLPEAERLFITEIHADLQGDTHFPPLEKDQWEETERVERHADALNPWSLSFTLQVRRSAPTVTLKT